MIDISRFYKDKESAFECLRDLVVEQLNDINLYDTYKDIDSNIDVSIINIELDGKVTEHTQFFVKTTVPTTSHCIPTKMRYDSKKE